jgi:hypothetical protein
MYNDILPGVNAGVSSRWGYRLPTQEATCGFVSSSMRTERGDSDH